MLYRVTFSKHYVYEVDAESESDAESNAYKSFKSEVSHPVADTHYDEVEFEALDDEKSED